MQIAMIALFGMVGVLFRYSFSVFVAKLLAPSFPYATLITNLLGAFLIGVIYTLAYERAMIPEAMRIAIMVGFLGGYTTFSAYCLESISMIEQSRFAAAFLYITASNLLGLAFTFAGLHLTRHFS